MSSEIAIKVENLSKCYQIYDQPRDRLKQFVLPRLRRLAGMPPKQYYREFWALKDVSFEVKKGETVGIIGRNGSGKSTLLQMICGTLSPTSGTIETKGRIAALLELGSGFNPEFTGLENIYLNASILGLSKKEIDQSLEEIIDFSELGEFVGQPVKTYSSGMVVRLAFSVTVHVKPDILVVDEALAVGDGAFQLKCMDRLKSLQEIGTTVLFVSHDLGSVGRLCSGVHILDKGKKLPAESVFDSMRTYERLLKINDQKEKIYKKGVRNPLKKYYCSSEYLPESLGTQAAVISEVDLLGESEAGDECFLSGEEVKMRLLIIAETEIQDVIIGFGLRNSQGVRVIGGNNQFSGYPLRLQKGNNCIEVSFQLNIVAGEYFLNIGLVKDDGERTDLDQRWGVRKILVTSAVFQVGQAYTSIEYRAL
jgi:lipopolysaccharide transport system ATP-binding protein